MKKKSVFNKIIIVNLSIIIGLSIVSCEKVIHSDKYPTVKTTYATKTGHKLFIGGEVDSDGGSSVFERGICFVGTGGCFDMPFPCLNNPEGGHICDENNGCGVFQCEIDLRSVFNDFGYGYDICVSGVNVCTYAVNKKGVSYGEIIEISF